MNGGRRIATADRVMRRRKARGVRYRGDGEDDSEDEALFSVCLVAFFVPRSFVPDDAALRSHSTNAPRQPLVDQLHPSACPVQPYASSCDLRRLGYG
jgi:hypothetical protein